MFPTKEQDIYIKQKEDDLSRSLYATLISSYLGRANEIPMNRRFPKKMTNEDTHEVYNALKKYTQLSGHLMWKREKRESISKDEIQALLKEYRILINYYNLPYEKEIIDGVLNPYKRGNH